MASRALPGVIMIVLAACGELVAIDASTPAADGGPVRETDANGPPVDVDAAPPDAAPFSGACDLSKDFAGITKLVTGTGDANTIGSGSRGLDDLTLVFNSNQNDTGATQFFRTFIAKRSSTAGTFANLAVQPLVSDNDCANDPFVASDRTFFWSSHNDDGDPLRIFHGVIDDGYRIAAPRELALGGGNDDFVQARLVGSTLYFARGTVKNGFAIWRTTLGPNDAITGTKRFDELANLDKFVWKAIVSPDERTLFFAVGTEPDRTSIMIARRSTAGATWETPSFVAELNAGGTGRAPTWLSPDGCQIWFESNRDGIQQLYVATRPK